MPEAFLNGVHLGILLALHTNTRLGLNVPAIDKPLSLKHEGENFITWDNTQVNCLTRLHPKGRLQPFRKYLTWLKVTNTLGYDVTVTITARKS